MSRPPPPISLARLSVAARVNDRFVVYSLSVQPYNAPKKLLDAAGVTIGVTYPAPVVSQMDCRERSVNSVCAEYKRNSAVDAGTGRGPFACACLSRMAAVVSGHGGQRWRFRRVRSPFHCMSSWAGLGTSVEVWGCTKQGFPLLVEEDLSNLLSQELISEGDGYVREK